MPDEPIRFYDDDGKKINPDLVAKPSLCISCSKAEDPSKEHFCVLNRHDQQDKEDFQCEAYTPKEE